MSKPDSTNAQPRDAPQDVPVGAALSHRSHVVITAPPPTGLVAGASSLVRRQLHAVEDPRGGSTFERQPGTGHHTL